MPLNLSKEAPLDKSLKRRATKLAPERQFSSTCGSGFSMTKKTTAIKRHQQELLALLKGINELLGIPNVPKIFDDQTEEAVESQKMMSIQEEQVIDGTID